MSLAITLIPYFQSPYHFLPYFLYVNKILLLLASFPTQLSDHFSVFLTALISYLGMAHGGGVLVNFILAEPFSMTNHIFFIYIGLWILFKYSSFFRKYIVEGIYGRKGSFLIIFLFSILNQYNRAVAILQREDAFEKIPGLVKGFDNLVGIAILSTLSSTTGTLLSSSLRPHLYRSYRVKPTDYIAVLWIFGLMLWYGLCRQWHTSSVVFIATQFEKLGIHSINEFITRFVQFFYEYVMKGIIRILLQIVLLISGLISEEASKSIQYYLLEALSINSALIQTPPEFVVGPLNISWSARDDVVVGYLIYPFVEIFLNMISRIFSRKDEKLIKKKNQ